MKLFFVLSLLSLSTSSNLRDLFLEQANIASVPITKERFRLFTQNLDKIRSLNSASTRWRAGITKFVSMTESEQALYKGLNTTSRVPGAPQPSPGAGPELIDWRTAGHVTGPREQWGCGSCWAFAAVAVIETRASAAGSPREHLSDQEMVDCASPYRDGCEGGDSLKAFEYVYDNNKITKQADYPYIGRSNENCQAAGKANGLSGVTQRYYTYRYGPGEMMAALAGGPIVIEFNAIEPFFYYKSGVFDYPECGPNVDHAMAAVGYTPNHVILKNSWGLTWGEQGFARVARGYNLCGMYKWGFHPNFLAAKQEQEE